MAKGCKDSVTIRYNITIMEKPGVDMHELFARFAPERGGIVSSIDGVYKALEDNKNHDPDCAEIAILGSEHAVSADDLRKKYGDRFAALLYSNGETDAKRLRELGVRGIVSTPDEAVDKICDILAAIEMVQKPEKKQLERPIIIKRVDEKEMKEYLHLRYRVWDRIGYLPEWRQNSDQLEADAYDHYSLQFCAVDGTDNRVVTALRFVAQEKQPQGELIETLLDSAKDLKTATAFDLERKGRIPSEEYSDITAVIDENEKNGRRVGELSRLAVHPEWKGRGVTKRLMEFGIASAMDIGYRIALSRCVTSQVDFYGKFGQYPIPGLEPKLDPLVQQMAYPLTMDFEKLPPRVEKNVNRMRNSLRERKEVLIGPDENETFEKY